jgi:hypothetical protein
MVQAGAVIIGARGGMFRPAIPESHAGEALAGDALKEFLTSYGITEEWFCSFKEKFGYPPVCLCPERQAWLNATAAAHPRVNNVGVKLLLVLTRRKKRRRLASRVVPEPPGVIDVEPAAEREEDRPGRRLRQVEPRDGKHAGGDDELREDVGVQGSAPGVPPAASGEPVIEDPQGQVED